MHVEWLLSIVMLDALSRYRRGWFDGQLNRLGSSMGAMVESNVEQSPEEVPPPEDLRTAAYLGDWVARLAGQMGCSVV